MKRSLRRSSGIAALALVATFGLAACSDDSGSDDTASDASSSATSESPMSESPSDSMSASGDMDDMPFGAGCSAIPSSGPGSAAAMSEEPVATAASTNPLLKTLTAAVKQAGLVDTLNSAEDITVFAPTDDAFAKIPPKDLKAVLADKATLTKILTYHVVPGELDPEDLAGTHKTLEGTDLEVAGSGEDFTVNGDAAVVCGNVETANAKVYVIDTVLMP